MQQADHPRASQSSRKCRPALSSTATIQMSGSRTRPDAPGYASASASAAGGHRDRVPSGASRSLRPGLPVQVRASALPSSLLTSNRSHRHRHRPAAPAERPTFMLAAPDVGLDQIHSAHAGRRRSAMQGKRRRRRAPPRRGAPSYVLESLRDIGPWLPRHFQDRKATAQGSGSQSTTDAGVQRLV